MTSLTDINKRFEAYVEHNVRKPIWWKSPKAYRAARVEIDRKNRIAQRGVPVPVYIVQANRAIYSAGGGAAYYCLVLFTFDNQRMNDREYMRKLVSTVASMKNTQQATVDGQYVAGLTTDERAQLDRRRPLPPSMTGGVTVYAADLILQRVRLNGGFLRGGNELVCLAEPEDPQNEKPAIELVPWWIVAQLPEQVPGYPFVELQPGEVLLYDRRPNPSAYARRRAGVAVWFGIILAAIMIWPVWTAPISVIATMVFVIVVVFAGMTLVRYRVEVTNGRSTRYVITNWRVAIQHVEVLGGTERARLAKAEFPLSTIKPRLRLGARGFGRVDLGIPKFSLRDIPDAQLVFDALSAACAEASTEGAAAVPGIDREMAEWSRTSGVVLRVGEQIQWYGVPVAWAYVRSEATIWVALTGIVGACIAASYGLAVGWVPAIGICALSWAFSWSGAIGSSLLRARNLDYYVTNQRVIIRKSTLGRVNVTDRELRETADMKMMRKGKGVGTLVLDKHSKLRFHGHFVSYSVDEFTFHTIPEPEQVAGLVASLRGQIR